MEPNNLEGFAKYKVLNNDSEDKATLSIVPQKSSDEGKDNCVKSKVLLASCMISFLIISGCIGGLIMMNKRIEDLKHLNLKLMNDFQEPSQRLSEETKIEGLKLQNQNLKDEFEHFKNIAKKVVNTFDSGYRTKLHLESAKGDSEMVKMILKLGADVSPIDPSFWTPLHFAASKGHSMIVKYLLEAGAEVDAKNNVSYTPLHLGAKNGHLSIVKLLIQHGASLNPKDFRGKDMVTPLHLASKNGYFKIVKFQIKSGANANASVDNNITPLHLAALWGHSAIGEFLLQHGADVNAMDGYSKTPLHYAAGKGDLKLVEILLKYGAKKNLKTNDGKTPSDMAEDYKFGDFKRVISLLTKN